MYFNIKWKTMSKNRLQKISITLLSNGITESKERKTALKYRINSV